MAKANILKRAFFDGMLAAKRCALTERPKNPYRQPHYAASFDAGVRRMRETGTMKGTDGKIR